MLTAERVIELLGMRPLSDEGGYYVETYRSSQSLSEAVLGPGYGGPRVFSTAILYLLTADTCSRLHRVRSDEIFHFYLGDAVSMVQLKPDGTCREVVLGSDILAGQKCQVVVPAETWQGAFVRQGGKFALMGCTVAPGFDFADYERGERETLPRQYPVAAEVVNRLT